MSSAAIESFLVGGLLVLIGGVVAIAWSIWRGVDRQRDMEEKALTGVGYELRENLTRMFSELARLGQGDPVRAADLLPISHPQLDGLLAGLTEKDREALTQIRSAYDHMGHRKSVLAQALSDNSDPAEAGRAATHAAIEGVSLLYLWTVHGGKSATQAPSTRSWYVRDWLKASPFNADMIPGLHLRDEVVKQLRRSGMVLTPKPLTHTAHEFYSMQYDRKADPNAPFWKRKQKNKDEEAALAPEVITATAAGAVTADLVEPSPVTEPISDTIPAEETISVAEPVQIEPEPDAVLPDPIDGDGAPHQAEPEKEPVA